MIALSGRANVTLAYLGGFNNDIEILVGLKYIEKYWGIKNPDEDYLLSLSSNAISELQSLINDDVPLSMLANYVTVGTYVEALLEYGYDTATTIAIASMHYGEEAAVGMVTIKSDSEN